MFDPVSYLMGAASGGSDMSLLLNYKHLQPAGSPAYEYNNTINIETAGSYLIVAHGYVSKLEVYVNGTFEPYFFRKSDDYTYMYNNEKSLSAGDTVRFLITSSGMTAVSALVIKTA